MTPAESVIHKPDEFHEQGTKTEIDQDIWKLQKQMTDRLILIQNKFKAILSQQAELEDHLIPQLFIVLPEELVEYDPRNWFMTKFRLHFICECGKHTEASDSMVPHFLHLAKHEGYLVRDPAEIFAKYGPFLLLMLDLIKFGIRIATVPNSTSLKAAKLADPAKHSVESLTVHIDYSLKCINQHWKKARASSPGDFSSTESHKPRMEQDPVNYLSDVEGLQGVELRRLGLFLKTSAEDGLLGSLYRMKTSSGHIKWVCLDHYRAINTKEHNMKLRDMVNLTGGKFDEQLGRIKIALTNSFDAAEFYHALHRAKGVVELIVQLGWGCAKSDLDALEEALKQSEVSILLLDIQHFQPSLGSRLLSTSTRYGVLFRIRELPAMKKIHIVLPKDGIKLLSLQAKKPSYRCKVTFKLVTGQIGRKEFGMLADTLKTNSVLITLDCLGNSIGVNGAQALSESLKTNSTLTTLSLVRNSIGDNGAKVISEALKSNSTLTTLDLGWNSIGDNGAQALSKALNINSTLTTLNLESNLISLEGVLALTFARNIKSKLTTLNLHNNTTRAQALFEAFKTNSILTTLDLGYNKIGVNGTQALSEVLKTNSTLTTLNLGSNDIR
ncbi:hypothetical protein BGZ83_011487, partial [Gryganskiella cystojenkinii]